MLLFVGVLLKFFCPFVFRIVCEMGKAEKSQYTGNVQVCVGVGDCRPEFMAKSSKYYYFVVSLFLYKHTKAFSIHHTRVRRVRHIVTGSCS